MFDFMGTCLDWHSSILSALPSSLSQEIKSKFAIDWRQAYFDANTARLASGLAPENIDITHRRTLHALLTTNTQIAPLFTEAVVEDLIQAWHSQKAWPDVLPALIKLKKCGYELFVHANGTTRLQLNIVRSSDLLGQFDMLFSSELLGVYKPAKENYEKVLGLLGYKAEECLTVAAHAYDLRGARSVGMRSVYVYRWTDDVEEDQKVIQTENDAWLEDMTKLDEVIAAL
jgi:2-haloalkanoic acid dehalogenase type II